MQFVVKTMETSQPHVAGTGSWLGREYRSEWGRPWWACKASLPASYFMASSHRHIQMQAEKEKSGTLKVDAPGGEVLNKACVTQCHTRHVSCCGCRSRERHMRILGILAVCRLSIPPSIINCRMNIIRMRPRIRQGHEVLDPKDVSRT